MVLLKCLCVLSIVATTYEQLSESGAACSKGKCAYAQDCPSFSRGDLCGSDKNHILLYCCIPRATTKVFNYYGARWFPEITQCGRSRPLNQIYQGDATEIGEYPWVAALLYVATKNTKYGGVNCGGTLITEKFVLTAAHCLIRQTPESIRVLLGDWNISSDSDPDPFPAVPCNTSNCTTTIEYADKVINATIDKIISHESYSSKTKRNDIALLRLENPVHFTDYVRPICLPSKNLPDSTRETELFVAGWGLTEKRSQSDILQKAKVYFLTNNDCRNKIQIAGIHETEFCAVSGESDACGGDSGGPLIRSYNDYSSNWFQLGIVGFGGNCVMGATATVYTRVSSFVNWIIDQITPQSERDSPCRTPDNENGSCTLINQCPVLEQQYLQPGNSSEVELIRRSICGFHHENRTDMVCCKPSQIERECKTPKPESKDGRCVRITNCPALKNASKAAREDIQEYHCGFYDELLVCCKTQDIVDASEPRNLEEFYSANIPNRTICGRIINNNTKSEYPWLAALMIVDDPINPLSEYHLRCAGSLINKRFVLIAASCFDGERILNYRILLGTGIADCRKTSDCPSSMKNLIVVQTILHPFYHSSYNLNNIALVRLGSDVVFNDYVSPICLPPPNLQPLRRGSEVTVATWASELRKNARNSEAYLWDAQSCIENPVSKTIHKQELCITNDTTVAFCSAEWRGSSAVCGGGSIVRAYKDQLGHNLFLEGIYLGSRNCYKRELNPHSMANVRISSYTNWILQTITKTT